MGTSQATDTESYLQAEKNEIRLKYETKTRGNVFCHRPRQEEMYSVKQVELKEKPLSILRTAVYADVSQNTEETCFTTN